MTLCVIARRHSSLAPPWMRLHIRSCDDEPQQTPVNIEVGAWNSDAPTQVHVQDGNEGDDSCRHKHRNVCEFGNP